MHPAAHRKRDEQRHSLVVRIAAGFAFGDVGQQREFILRMNLPQRQIADAIHHVLGFFLTIHCKLSANFFRARNNRDFTVPSGRPVNFATSVTLYPSMAARVITRRNFSGSASSAWATWRSSS